MSLSPKHTRVLRSFVTTVPGPITKVIKLQMLEYFSVDKFQKKAPGEGHLGGLFVFEVVFKRR